MNTTNESEVLIRDEKEILKILQEAQYFDYENLVKVWNSYCEERGYLENKIYKNTVENLIALLPENPLDAFLMGQYVGDTYSQTDMWLALDETNNVFSFTDDMLFACAINIYSLAIYIANFDEDKQQEILDELI